MTSRKRNAILKLIGTSTNYTPSSPLIFRMINGKRNYNKEGIVFGKNGPISINCKIIDIIFEQRIRKGMIEEGYRMMLKVNREGRTHEFKSSFQCVERDRINNII